MGEEVFTLKFRNEFWTRKPASFPGTPGQFDGLITIDDIEKILAHSSVGNGRIQLATNGQYIDYRELSNGSDSDFSHRPRSFDAHKIEFYLTRGATLIVNGIDEIHEPIAAVAADIEFLIGIPIQINLYASWGSSAGFNIHWDEHEVLVLQLSGQKEWRLYGATADYPVRLVVDPPRPETEPHSIALLNSGDALYVPRGHWHSVVPRCQPTIHLTIGIHTSSGLDLVRSLCPSLAHDSFVRSTLPQFRSAPSELDQYSRILRDLIVNFVDRDFVGSFIASRERSLRKRRFVNLRSVSHLVSRSLEKETTLRLVSSGSKLPLPESGQMAVFDDGVKRFFLSQQGVIIFNIISEVCICNFSDMLQKLPREFLSDDARDVVIELCEAGLVSLHD